MADTLASRLDTKLQQAAAAAAQAFALLGPPYTPEKPPTDAAAALYSYACGIKRRLEARSSIPPPSLVTSLCACDPRLIPLQEYFTALHLTDLRIVTATEFERMVQPRHLLYARIFTRMYASSFKQETPTTTHKAPSAAAEMDLASRKELRADGTYLIDCTNLFRSASSTAFQYVDKPFFEASGVRQFSTENIIKLLEEMNVHPSLVRGISFKLCGLYDRDVGDLDAIMAHFDNCVQLDISCNRHLVFDDPEQRAWLSSLLRRRVFVISYGNRSLLYGSNSVLHYLQSSGVGLSHFIWLQPHLVRDVANWRSSLKRDDPDAVEEVLSAHKRYYGAIGVAMCDDDDGSVASDSN